MVKKKIPDKPKPVSRKPALNYFECIRYIKEKYKRDPDDWAGKFYPKYKEDAEFLCFWHWILENYTNINNGTCFTFNFDMAEGEPKWIQEIHDIIKEEFKDYIKNEELEFYVYW